MVQFPPPLSPSQVLDASVLKPLHSLLLQLSSSISPSQDWNGDTVSVNVSDGSFVTEIRLSEISNLSDVLFKELEFCFAKLLTGVVPDVAWKQFSGYVVLLFRCCVVMLHLLEFNLTSLTEKCNVLVKILRKLCFSDRVCLPPCETRVDVEGSAVAASLVSRKCQHGRSDCTVCFPDDSDPSIRIKCSLLEAFADELAVHRDLVKHFRVTDHIYNVSEELFVPHSSYADIGAILEVVSAQFLQTVNDEKGFIRFCDSLFWSNEMGNEVPELSLTATMTLLRTSVIFSGPCILQAHLILLASRSIGVHFASSNSRQKVTPFDDYMSAFDYSVNLYGRLLPRLQLGSDLTETEGQSGSCLTKWHKPENCFHFSFDSCIHPATRDKIKFHILQLAEFHGTYSHSAGSRTKAYLISTAMAYLEESKHIIEDMFREEAILFIKNIIEMAVSNETRDNVLSKSEGRNWQDVYCVAALLKLMSSSLLQIVRALRKSGTSDGIRVSNDYVLSGEYDTISGIICSFLQCCGNHLVPRVVNDLMETYSASYNGTMLMLAHFADILIYSLDRGVECLSKGCIFMIMVLLNLLIFKEGSLDSVRPVFVSAEKSSGSPLYPSKMRQTQAYRRSSACRRSSYLIASNFVKSKDLFLEEISIPLTQGKKRKVTDDRNITKKPKRRSRRLQGLPPINSAREPLVDVTKCTGEVFLESLGFAKSDVSDLADFIVCRRGKDYPDYLKKKEKHRKWRLKKVSAARHQERMEILCRKFF